MMVRALVRSTLLIIFAGSAATPAFAQTQMAQATSESKPVVPALERAAQLDIEEQPVAKALTTLSKTSGVTIAFSPSVIESERRVVSCHCVHVTVAEALRRLLAGTAFHYSEFNGQVIVYRPTAEDPRPSVPRIVPVARLASLRDDVQAGLLATWNGVLAITTVADKPARIKRRNQAGSISGRVTDATTGAVLSGVSIVVEGTGRGALTDASGRYRVSNVAAGMQRISAVSLGFVKATKEVEVQNGGVATADFALAAEAVALDRFVVTGNVTKTKIKELTSPISVVDAREIEQRQIQRVDQLFRGAIPGAIAWDMGPYNYYSEITVRGKNSLYFDYIKTYIDGIEVASPLMIATLDPNSIERIEVVRGPQASTLYGSDAAGGVLQIFTKKGMPGVARPQIAAKLSAGLIETDYMTKNPTTQEHSLSVNGGGQEFSYNFGGTYLAMGEYVPEAQTDNTSVFAAARTSQGALTAEITGRYYTKHFGWPLNPVLHDAGYAFYSKPRDETHNIRQSTVGLNVGYQLRPNWQHNLAVGVDRSQFDDFGNKPRRTTPADTFVMVNTNQNSRASLRYNTSLDLELSNVFAATLTGGFDRSLYNYNGMFTQAARRNEGFLDASNASLTRMEYTNTGYFTQAKLGVHYALFLTAGIRVEENENFGADFGRAVAPRAGVSYSRALRDNLNVKLRGSWGKGIRAPQPFHKQESVTATARVMANPEIGPEEQKGWDAGIELYFGRRGSLSVTYYDQRAVDLIDQVLLQPPAQGRVPVFQYQNVGEMANHGWELEGTLFAQPFRFSGTFSTTSSKVEKLAANYLGDLRVGDRNLKIPESQAGLSVAYDFLRGSATLDVTYIGSFVNTDWVSLYGFYFGGQQYRGSGRAYWMDYDALTRLNLRVEQAVTHDITAFVRVENFTGDQLGERDNTQVTAGRMTVLGVRIAR
jgi:outer membrane receptor protein involved in Fe transport